MSVREGILVRGFLFLLAESRAAMVGQRKGRCKLDGVRGDEYNSLTGEGDGDDQERYGPGEWHTWSGDLNFRFFLLCIYLQSIATFNQQEI